MTDFRIAAKIDPTGVQSGAATVKQELRQLDVVYRSTGQALQQAFGASNTDAAVSKLVGLVGRLDSNITKLRTDTAALTAANSSLRSSIDQLATATARNTAETGASAAANARAGATEAQLEAAKRRVLAVTDAEALEIMRLNQIMADANRLFQAGKITQEQYAAAQRLVAQGAAVEGATLGQRRAGYQQLGFQIQDITMQAALGVSPLVILAQQAGQTAAAVTMMTGATRGFWAFIGGPWGSVVIAAIAVLGQLATAFFSAGSAADSDTAATQHNLSATDALGQAKAALGHMFDLTTGRVRDNTEATRLNTLALITNLRLQAQAQLLQSSATLTVGRTLPGVIDRMAAQSGLFGAVATAAQGSPLYPNAQANQEILRRNGLSFSGRQPTEQGRATALLELGARELSLRNDAANEGNRVLRQQLLQAADSTHSLMEAVNNQVQGIRTQRVADEAFRSVMSGNLDPDFKTAHRGGGRGSHADPVGDFFQRLTQQRDIAGMPQGLGRRITDAQQDFARAANRDPSIDEQARIAALVRETEARETLLHLTQTYTDTAEREYQMLGELGIRRKMHNAVLEEEARLGRALSPIEEAVVRDGVRNADAYQRQQAAIEQLDGGLQEYSDNMEAYLRLLRAGTITQAQFNIMVGQTPFQRQVDDLDAALGGMRAYDAQLRQIEQTSARYVELINQRARLSRDDPNYLSPEAAQAARVAVRGSDTGEGEIGVGGPSNWRDRQVADLRRRQREQLRGVDSQLGGNYAHEAERQQAMDENAERLRLLREFREQELITEEEYNQRVIASREAMNQKLREIDAARYQAAFHAASESFGQVADLLKEFAGEHSRAYRAMFIVSKAFAIAESVVAIQVAIAQAMKLPFPANIPAIAQAIALGVGIIANIRSVTAQFQGGGYTGDGAENEPAGTVHGKEFVVNAPGTRRNRALLEAINAGATVRGTQAANALGAGAGARGGVSVTINDMAGGVDFDVQQGPTMDEVIITARRVAREEAPRAVAADMHDPNGPVAKSMGRNFNVQRNRP